jgi:hypothetical protein
MMQLNRENVLALRSHLSAIDGILRAARIEPEAFRPRLLSAHDNGNYTILFRGESLRGNTLPDLICRVIEALEVHQPEALVALSMTKARVRRYISRRRGAVHPGRMDLAIGVSAGGWYFSRNIGLADARRWLAALCRVTGMKQGVDVGTIEVRRR